MTHQNLTGSFLDSMLRAIYRAPHERWLSRVALGLGAFAPVLALANPTGGQVVAGSATIGSAGANGLVIDQSSQRAVINWQQFSIGANQYVQFVQPNSSSVVLNRVIGNNPSSIFGDIKANGQVFLINPNGILFAPGATLDVSGLAASTLDISDSDFMAGDYQFSQDPGATGAGVVNQGVIRTKDGGYVVLAGDYVQNHGQIDARLGSVYLAAGGAATLTLDGHSLISYVVDGATLSRMAGVMNTGEITAMGGTVVMTADVANALTATAVNNTGFITAHSVRQHGGTIVLEAEGTGIYNSGVLDASATTAGVQGGTVILHGDGKTELTSNSQIDAAGDGATGGLIDISGHGLSVHGFITAGKDGNLLLDPSVINIVSGNGTGGQTNGTNSVGTGFIAGKLSNGSNVAIVASSQIKHVSGTGITATGTGNLIIETGTVGCPTGICVAGTPTITPGGGGSIDLTGLAINIKGGFTAHAGNSSGNNGHVTLGNVTAGNISVTGEYINVGKLHATGVGGISIHAVGSSDDGGSLFGGTMTADNGPVTIVQLGGHTGISIGGISAKGNVDVDDASSRGHFNLAINGDVTGKSVTLWAEDGNLNVIGNVKGNNGDVTLKASAGSSVRSGGNIHVTGNISALQHGNVTITAFGGGTGEGLGGGNVNVGNITAAGFVGISASYTRTGHAFQVQTGTITAGASGASRGGIGITMAGAGAVLKTGALLAQGLRSVPCSCEGGPVRGGDIAITIEGNAGGGSVTVASAKSSHGRVSISDAAATVTVSGDITAASNVNISGRVLNFGNITALGQSINITERNSSSVLPATIHQTAGTTLKARNIDVELNASYGGAMTLANLTASSSNGAAEISLQATTIHNRANSITVNGNISVSGKGSSPSNFQLGQTPAGATLLMTASGSAGQAHTIKVTGAINVTAHAGNVNIHHALTSCECGTVVESGNIGMGQVFATATGSHGSVQLLGATTVKGTDAQVVVTANTIKTGALTVAGSGHILSLNVHRSNSASNHATLGSNNSTGRGVVSLMGNTSGAGATTINTGNITVTGKGSASVQMAGNAITAGNIAVTATAAKGTRTLTGTGNDLRLAGQNWFQTENPGLFGVRMDTGNYSAGRADVFIAGSEGSSHSHGATAQSIKLGSVSATGVGEADISLRATVIQTGSLNATAAGGNMKGSFNSSNEGGAFHQTFTFKNEGEANIQLDTGSAGNGAIIVTGSANASGPVAGVNLFAHTIKVTKGITVAGHGGQATVSGSGTGGAGFTSDFKGPGPITAISLGGEGSNNAASINVGGTAKVTGPGLVGIAITGAKVTLGGLFASASNVETYKIVNTHNGTNDTFTAGSAAVLVFQESGGAVTGPATVNGNVTIDAPHGNVVLGTQLNVSGQVAVNAAVNIGDDISGVITRINEISEATGGNGSSSGGPSLPANGVTLNIKAAGISMIATVGSIDLTGATVTTSGVTALFAGKDIILSGVTFNTGTLAADAGSTIHNGGATGTITTKALALNAGKDINLSSTNISVGSGVLAPVASNAALTKMLADPGFAAIGAGDPLLLGGLATAGIAPAAAGPNAAFKAGGSVTLGALTLTGSYLYLQGNTLTLLGPISTPTGAVVQLAPAGVTGNTDAEGTGATGGNLNLNDTGFFSLFADGTTLVLGGAGQTGAVDLGNNGTFNIGSDNLVVYTTGAVTGLGNVISTGQVVSLSSLLNGLPPVTAGEIDPSTTTNNPTGNDKKHTEDENGNDTGGSGQPPITQDTGNSSVCH